jgi:hypothetical protein
MPPAPNQDQTRRLAAGTTSALPGSFPRIWNAPPRSPSFVGRDELLIRLHELLKADGRTAVFALHGMGGVGKTQAAVDYAYRFAGEYELVWWVINAEQPGLVAEQLASLAVAANLVATEAPIPAAVAAVKEYLRTHDRWLVVFDNVPAAEDAAGWLPAGRAM